MDKFIIIDGNNYKNDGLKIKKMLAFCNNCSRFNYFLKN